MIIADAGKTLIRPLAMLVIATALAGAPVAATAFEGESDTGRGEAPQRISVDMDTLYRLNDDTLFRLSRQRNVWINGKMSRFASVRVIPAVQFAPERTRQLVRRYERTRSDAEALKMVESEMEAMRNRYGITVDSYRSLPADPAVASYYTLLEGMYIHLSTEEFLRLRRENEDPEERSKRYRRLMGIF